MQPVGDSRDVLGVSLRAGVLAMQPRWLGVVRGRSDAVPGARRPFEPLAVGQPVVDERVVVVDHYRHVDRYHCLDQFGDAPETLFVVVLDGQSDASPGREPGAASRNRSAVAVLSP